MVKGMLFYKRMFTKDYEPDNQRKIVVPRSMIGDVLQTCHDDISGAHLGVNKTWAKIYSRFQWDNMMEDLVGWIVGLSTTPNF